MKKSFLFLLAVLFTSYTINSLENNIIILTEEFMTFLPDAKYKITSQDGRITEGRTNRTGVVTVDSAISGSFLLELDLEYSYYVDDYWEEFDLPVEKSDDFEIVYLTHPEDDLQILELEDGRKITVIEHSSFCDLKYTVTLKSGKNYILVFQPSRFSPF